MNLKYLILISFILFSVIIGIILAIILTQGSVATKTTTVVPTTTTTTIMESTTMETTSTTTTTETTITTTTTTTTTTTLPDGYSKMVIVGGTQDGPNGITIVEVYDLLKLTNNCSSIKDFPLNSKKGAFGGLSPEGRPILCGGTGLNSSCYGLLGDSWVLYNQMNFYRSWSTSVTVPKDSNNADKMLVMGGFDLYLNMLDSFDELDENGWHSKAPVPIVLFDTCIVVMDANTYMAAAGRMGQNFARLGNTYIYNQTTNIWKPGPTLPMGISSHSCGMVNKDSTGSSKVVIIIGGENDLMSFDSTYILNQEATGWHQGPTLPNTILNAKVVQDPFGAILLVGGQQTSALEALKSIYRLMHGDAAWELLSVELKVPRFRLSAFLIPEGYVTCQ